MHRTCLLSGVKRTCPFAGHPHSLLLGVKRTWAVALHMSAFDPKRTLEVVQMDRSSIGTAQCAFGVRFSRKSFTRVLASGSACAMADIKASTA